MNHQPSHLGDQPLFSHFAFVVFGRKKELQTTRLPAVGCAARDPLEVGYPYSNLSKELSFRLTGGHFWSLQGQKEKFRKLVTQNEDFRIEE